MYLVLGSRDDPFCRRVHEALEAGGHATRIVENPLVHPARFSWRLDTERSVSRFSSTDTPGEEETIEGVLVRGGGWINPADWQADDLAYAQAETQAALVAWLASLPCPVINRYTAESWYRPQVDIGFWRQWLTACGLSTPPMRVSNVEQAAGAFRRQASADGLPGAIFRPLTSEDQYFLATDDDWSGLVGLQQRMPVCIMYPHEEPVLVCVVGDRLVWNGTPPPEVRRLDGALLRFAAVTGLLFVEIVLARIGERFHVVQVEHQPHVERFTSAAQDEIVATLMPLLVESQNAGF